MDYKEMLKKYPKSVMDGRKSIEANVLGCLFNDILLVKEYKIKNSDFVSEEGKFYYDIVKHLSDKSILEPTDTDIRLLCSDDVIQTYKAYNGFKRIEQMKNIVDIKNFPSYIDELYKRNLYIKLINEGYNLEKEIEIVNKKKTIHISPIDLFESANMTSEEVVNFMQTRLSDMDVISHDNSIEESDGHIEDSFIEDLCEGKEMGIMFDDVGVDIDGDKVRCLPHISKEILGLKRSTLSMIGAFVNVGKTTLLSNIILSLADKGETVLVVTNEMKVKDFKMAFLVYTCAAILKHKSITKKKLKSGKLTDEEKEVLNRAKDEYNKRFGDKIILCSIPDSNMDMVDRLTRKYALSRNSSTLVYDTFKMNFDKNGEVSYKDLIKDSRHAEKLCKKYNMIGLCAIQLSQQFLGNLILDLSMLAGAKQVNEILWNLMMMRSVYNDKELDPKNEKYYIRPFTFEKENGKWKRKPFKVDKDGTYRVMFLTKTRDGETFEDSRTAVLLHYNGKYGVFKELCLCEPQRAVINQYSK